MTALICLGRTGFFVPSLEYRALIDVEKSEPYRLLEDELRVADEQIGELRLANEAGTKASDKWRRLFQDEEIEARVARFELESLRADVDKRWSPTTWMGIGAGAVVVIGVIGLVVGLSL